MKYPSSLWVLATLVLLQACKPETPLADAYGNFEAREVLVSSEVSGRLLQFSVEEGQFLEAGTLVGLVDTIPLHLRRRQLQASMHALQLKTQDAAPQIQVYEAQYHNLLREIARLEVLLKSNAATPKQLDDLKGQAEVVQKQIQAARSQEKTANRAILAELDPLETQLLQLEDQIARCYIFNPVSGTVLIKMSEPSEMIAAAKPLYKIANLDTMTLRAYFSGDQLPYLKIGDTVDVLIDADKKTNRALQGTISWIAAQAEFTPKIVQTKNERVNLVYAVKIMVKNDGALKIGMPAEVNLPAR